MPLKDHDCTRYFDRVLLTCLTAILALAAGCGSELPAVIASPSQITIYPGQQNVAVKVSTTASGYSGTINITMAGLPSGVPYCRASRTRLPP